MVSLLDQLAIIRREPVHNGDFDTRPLHEQVMLPSEMYADEYAAADEDCAKFNVKLEQRAASLMLSALGIAEQETEIQSAHNALLMATIESLTAQRDACRHARDIAQQYENTALESAQVDNDVVTERVSEAYAQNTNTIWDQSANELNRILPQNQSGVGNASWMQTSVMTVNKWQREKRLTAEQADREYMAFMAETKTQIMADIEERRTQSVTLPSMDINPVIAESFNELITPFFTVLNDLEGMEVDDAKLAEEAFNLDISDPQKLSKLLEARSLITRSTNNIRSAIHKLSAVGDDPQEAVRNRAATKIIQKLQLSWGEQVKKEFRTIVERRLAELDQALQKYEAASDSVVPEQTPRTKRRNQAGKLAVKGAGVKIASTETEKTTLESAETTFFITSTIFPWLEKEDARELPVKNTDASVTLTEGPKKSLALRKIATNTKVTVSVYSTL